MKIKRLRDATDKSDFKFKASPWSDIFSGRFGIPFALNLSLLWNIFLFPQKWSGAYGQSFQ